jgi:hypothetical protein
MMAPWLILLVGGIYAIISADLWMSGKPAMAAVFIGYSFSNLGLWAASR